MFSFDPQPTWTYNDLLMSPSTNSIVSHKKVKLEHHNESIGLTLPMPLVTAPMQAIRNPEMYYTLWKDFGILPWIDRYTGILELEKIIQQLHPDQRYIAIAVSTKDEDFVPRIHAVKKLFPQKPIIVKVDVAHGASLRSINAINNIRKQFPNIIICSGNVCDADAAIAVAQAGANIVCVGIGGGSSCTTRMQTGIGKGNAHAVCEVAQALRQKERFHQVSICADGGFHVPGDLAKALALGADFCMSGRFFYTGNLYYGMASTRALSSVGKENRSPEGETIELPQRKLMEVFNYCREIEGALKSFLSYVGCESIADLHDNPPRFYQCSIAVVEEGRAR